MKFEEPIIEILRFDEEEILTLSVQQASMNQEAQYFLGRKQTEENTTGVDIRKMNVTVN